MFRVIREVHPKWIITENVPGLININKGMAFENLCLDLESENYKIQSFIIPASAIGAPHKRDRVWIIGHLQSSNTPHPTNENDRKFIRKKESRQVQQPGNNIKQGVNTDTNEINGNNGGYDSSKIPQFQETEVFKMSNITNSGNKRLQRSKRGRAYEESQTSYGSASECRNAWDEPWIKVANRTCSNVMDDGISSRVVRPRGWRTNALKAIGNSVVVPLVYEIMGFIKSISIEEEKDT